MKLNKAGHETSGRPSRLRTTGATVECRFESDFQEEVVSQRTASGEEIH